MENPQIPEIVISVPGKWKDRSEVVKSIAQNSGGYIFAGMVMIHVETKEVFEIEIQEYDSDYTTAFQNAGEERITEEQLDIIEEHTFTLYLIKEGAGKEIATSMIQAANGLASSGGLGVKVETTGKAFSKEQWNAIAADKSPKRLFDAFVILLRYGEETIYTCGMHNLGMGDSIISGEDIPFAAKVLQTFCLYRILENPVLSSGETFALNEQSPNFVLTIEPCFIYEPGDPFYNPYKLWRMTWEARLKMENENVFDDLNLQ